MAKNLVFKTETGRKKILSYYDQILNQWLVNSKKQFIKTRYGFTFVIECGVKSKPPLILLHGAGSNSAMWSADIIEYSKKYRVFAVDIIGECGKSAENRPNFKSIHYSNWLLDVFEAFQIKKANLVGCSLGGWIAMKFTIFHPEKVSKLALIATSGITQIKPSLIFWLLVISVLGKWGFNKMNKIVYNNIKLDQQTIKFSQLVKQHFIPRTDALPLFEDYELQKVKIPVFFVGGVNDCFFNSEKTAARLKRNITQADFKILENTGHVITVSANHILKFFKVYENKKNKFSGILEEFINKAQEGNSSDIDFIIKHLTPESSLPITRYIDFALSLVNNEAGIRQLEFYLFHGSLIQRNYCSLFFNRRGDWTVVKKAYRLGLIDEIQAYSR